MYTTDKGVFYYLIDLQGNRIITDCGFMYTDIRGCIPFLEDSVSLRNGMHPC